MLEKNPKDSMIQANDGTRIFRVPTTHGSFGKRAKDKRDSWIYMDDFDMVSAEDGLPKYPD